MKVQIAILTLLSLIAGSSAPAATIYVPGQVPTIQEAIDLAVHGDLILVAPGTYTGEGNRMIDFRGKSIELRSTMGPEVTIIDLAGWAPGLEFQNGETRDCVVDGFTITGEGWFGSYGRGIRVLGSSPTIRNCALLGNAGNDEFSARGAGIYCQSGAPLIESCTIGGNTSVEDAGFYTGSGVYAAGGSEVTIVRSIIWGNCNNDIAASSTSTVTLECCVVDPDGLHGEGITLVGNNSFEDPEFCDPLVPCTGPNLVDPFRYFVSSTSPAHPDNSPCGEQIGALGLSCDPSSAPEVDGGAVSEPFRVVLAGIQKGETIRFTLSGQTVAVSSVEVIDAVGRSLWRESPTESAPHDDARTVTPDLEARGTGVYFLRVRERAGSVATAKFVWLRE